MRVYPDNTGTIFTINVFIATNHNLILDLHPHPHLLPSREKESKIRPPSVFIAPGVYLLLRHAMACRILGFHLYLALRNNGIILSDF
jgi:hypothetical protein